MILHYKPYTEKKLNCHAWTAQMENIKSSKDIISSFNPCDEKLKFKAREGLRYVKVNRIVQYEEKYQIESIFAKKNT